MKRLKTSLVTWMLLLAATLLSACGWLPEAESESPLSGVNGTDLDLTDLRDFYTQLQGEGKDVCTLMIYIIGADLEEEAGAASQDIQEMLAAETSNQLHVILQTGGAADWEDPNIQDGQVQRWQISQGQLLSLENLGRVSMAEPRTLTDFINYCTANYPADRYGLILWNHGGGSLYGFGSDELFGGDCLYLHDIDKALAAAGTAFDFVGFDSCLMGTLETAYMLEPYADYLIASEENEPLSGWSYTPWLDALAKNTSIDTVELGKIIIDSFAMQNEDRYTLSLVSLREVPYLYQQLGAYLAGANALDVDSFRTLSAARADTKAFGDKAHDMVDLGDFVQRAGLPGGDQLLAALDSTVKYRNASSLQGVHGLSFYFPYYDLFAYSHAREFFTHFGFSGPIYQFFDRFVNVIAGAPEPNSTFQQKLQHSDQIDYSGEDWYDPTLIDGYDYGQVEVYHELELIWSDADDCYILSLTPEDWSLLTDIQQEVLLDDGEGYVDLGTDQYYEVNQNGDLLVIFDNTWVALDGQVVPYYAEETIVTAEGVIFTGYVPAVLNGETEIDIMLQWDSEDADAGSVSGYRHYEEADFGIGTVGRGLKQFVPGDQVDFLCDFYTYEGDYDGPYYWGETLAIGETPPQVTYADLGDYDCLVSYALTDIYQNRSWTQMVEFYME